MFYLSLWLHLGHTFTFQRSARDGSRYSLTLLLTPPEKAFRVFRAYAQANNTTLAPSNWLIGFMGPFTYGLVSSLFCIILLLYSNI